MEKSVYLWPIHAILFDIFYIIPKLQQATKLSSTKLRVFSNKNADLH